MAKLSVLLPTYNEENNLEACLESVRWADEILIIDSYSTDKTLEIARTYGARIIQHEYINSAKQKNWAIPQCTNEWVLQIDADERLTSELQAEIQQLLLNDPPDDVDGYLNPTRNHMFGRWIWSYPDPRLRLFRRDKGRFQDREVDARVIVPGKVDTMQYSVLHYGFETISQKLKPLDRYTRYEADERDKQRRHFSWFNIIVRPLAAFIHAYFYRRAFLFGLRGLILAVYRADFVFWTYAKLWEKEHRAGKRE
jgi:glycosyltransferase involved in cell wall biosynthesis